MRLRRALAGIVVAASLCGFGAAAVAATSHHHGWTIQSTPNASGAVTSYLNSVSCPAVRRCLAVGYWAATAAVGSPLAERWNGRAWRMQSFPRPAGASHAYASFVSCRDALDCFAVGSWDTSSYAGMTLAEHWDGHKWTVQPSASVPGGLTSVSCPSTNSCIAVGYMNTSSGFSGLSERWNGKRWKQINLTATPPDTELDGVSCTAKNSCEAVGFTRNSSSSESGLALHWNGSQWTAQRTAGVSGSHSLDRVSCTTPRECTAVGAVSNAPGMESPLIERWDGTRWTVQHAPTPSGSTYSYLDDVSCASGRACIAVGYYTPELPVTALRGAILAERWNGKSWTMQRPPLPAGAAHSYLQGVSCTTTKLCTAVGYSDDSIGRQHTLAERWRGR